MTTIRDMVQEVGEAAVQDFISRGIGLGTAEGESQISIDVIIRRVDDDFPKRLDNSKTKRWASSIIGNSSCLYVYGLEKEQ